MSQEPKARLSGIQQFTQSDFTGGQNESVSDTLLDTSESPSANNISLDKSGVLEPRKGIKKLFSSPFANSGVLGLHGYYKSTGAKKLLFMVEDKAFESTLKSSTIFTTQADFEEGLIGDYTSASESPGNLVLYTNSANYDLTFGYTSDSEFESGTLIRVDSEVSPGNIVLDGLNADKGYLDTSYADFNTGVLTKVKSIPSGRLTLAIPGYEWSNYANNMWEELHV